MKRIIMPIWMASLLFLSAHAVGNSVMQKLSQLKQQRQALAELEAEQIFNSSPGNMSCGCDIDFNITAESTINYATDLSCAPTLPDLVLNCNCNTSGSGLPAPGGAANVQAFTNGAMVSQMSVVNTLPNNAQQTVCESNCCACSAAEEASCAKFVSERNYQICGSLCASEVITLNQFKNATEQSKGQNSKTKTIQTMNAPGGSSAPPGGPCVSICLNNSNTGGSGALNGPCSVDTSTCAPGASCLYTAAYSHATFTVPDSNAIFASIDMASTGAVTLHQFVCSLYACPALQHDIGAFSTIFATSEASALAPTCEVDSATFFDILDTTVYAQ